MKRSLFALISGFLLALCFPPFGLHLLMPLALAGFLWAIHSLTPRLAFYIGILFGMAFFGTALHWLWNLFGTGSIGLWALCALFPAMFASLLASLGRRGLPKSWIPFAAAFVWTSVEFVRSEVMFPACPLMGLGYAFVKAPGFASLTSLVGSYGLTFVVVLFSAFLQQMLVTDIPKGSLRPAFVLAAYLAVLFIPRHVAPPTRVLNVRVVQAASEDLENLLLLSPQDNNLKPDVIVWPEYSFLTDVRGDAKSWAKVQALPRSLGAYLLFGGKDEGAKPAPPVGGKKTSRKPFTNSGSDEFKNTAFLLDPNGAIVATHVKNHTVPFIKDGTAGTSVTVADTPKGKLGIAICYDMDFADVSRKMAQGGAEIFLVPSNNPAEWGVIQKAQHAQMFGMRAIECGRWIAVADVAGSTALYAPNGQNILVAQTDKAFASTQTAGLETGRTIYVAFGWLFPYVCLAGTAALFAFTLRRKGQDSSTDSGETRKHNAN